MLNFGLIEKYKGELKVRVPATNGMKGQSGATASKDLPKAILNSREKDGYKDGDTVIVGYVYSDPAYPVVLFPYGVNPATAAQITAKALVVENNAVLPAATDIGAVKGAEIANIKGLNYPLVEKIRQLEEKPAETVDLTGISTNIQLATIAANKANENADTALETANIANLVAMATYNEDDNIFEVTLDYAPDKLDLDNGVRLKFVAPADLKAGAKIKIMNSEYYTHPTETGGVWKNYFGSGYRTATLSWDNIVSSGGENRYANNGYRYIHIPVNDKSMGCTPYATNFLAANTEYTKIIQTKDGIGLGVGTNRIVGSNSGSGGNPFTSNFTVAQNNAITKAKLTTKAPVPSTAYMGYIWVGGDNLPFSAYFRAMYLLGDVTAIPLPADYWENDFGTWDIKPVSGGAYYGGEFKKDAVVDITLGVSGAYMDKAPVVQSTQLPTSSSQYLDTDVPSMATAKALFAGKTRESAVNLTVSVADLQSTISSLPRLLNYDVTITVTGVEVATAIGIHYFYGSGALTIQAASSESVKVAKVSITYCTLPLVHIKGIESTIFNGKCFDLWRNTGNIRLEDCMAKMGTNTTSENYGIFSANNAGLVDIIRGEYTNRRAAVYCNFGKLNAWGLTGSGNYYGYYATDGGIVSEINAGTLAATNKYTRTNSGIIIKPDSTFA